MIFGLWTPPPRRPQASSDSPPMGTPEKPDHKHKRGHMPAGGRGEPSSDERREIEELRALIGQSPARPSTLAHSTFMRWQVGEEARYALLTSLTRFLLAVASRVAPFH